MSSTIMLTRQITIYGGFPIFLSGTIGNILNVILLWRTRENPCGLIFIYSSFVNCFVLFYGLFTRILSVGFELDWSNTNRIWCKTRATFSQTSFLIGLTCVSLSSIDRFLSSCREEKYRRLSRLSFAQIALFLTSFIWILHSIPSLIYTDLLPNANTGVIVCAAVPNQHYSNYRLYVSLPIYLGSLPALILITTGLLTYRNLSKLQLVRQRQIIQRQLTIMMLIQIPIIVCSILPYVIFLSYTAMTATQMKSTYQRSIESLTTNVVTLLFYVTNACPFYVFLASSKSFRDNFINLILCRKMDALRQNQVEPFSIDRTKNPTETFLRTN